MDKTIADAIQTNARAAQRYPEGHPYRAAIEASTKRLSEAVEQGGNAAAKAPAAKPAASKPAKKSKKK